MKITLRNASRDDLPYVLNLIRELALFEKAAEEVTITLNELEKDGFDENPLFEIVVAETENKEIVGMTFCYYAYSTWKGKCLFLEDIIVKEQFRQQGIGKQLFEAVLKRAKEVNAKRLMWQVLNWNTPAIEFYKKYNADISSEWLNGRMTQEKITDLIITKE